MAVYTEINREQLDKFLSSYDLGEVVSFSGITEGVENSNYLLSTTEGKYILTVYEKRVKSSDLPFYLGLMDHLANFGIPCPTPVAGHDGLILRKIENKSAAIVTFLTGLWPKRPRPVHCYELGKAMAKMHSAGIDYNARKPNELGLEGWRLLFNNCQERADEVSPDLKKYISDELNELEAQWPKELPSGVIHADLFPDNVFFKEESLTGIIDFYFACNDFFAYDIAICINAWCFEIDNSFNITKARNLLEGYQSERGLSESEVLSVPLLSRGAAMRFLLTRLHDWLHQIDGALVKPKDPLEYLSKLRFHQNVSGPGAYGLI